MANAVKIFDHFETPVKEGVYHRLVCLTGDNKGKAYFIMGNRIVMGRSETCDVTILDLKSSREHAEIILVGGNYILTDLGSQNGIVVNDLKIKQHTLTNGDKIIIGKTVYKFSKVEVKEEKKEKNKKKKKEKKTVDEDFYEDNLEEEPKNKRLVMVMGVVIILALMLLVTDDSGDVPEERARKKESKIKGMDESFRIAIQKRNLKDKKTRAKLAKYLNRGRREYREGNYFRAISQFESALQILPNDRLTAFHLRKAREKLDEQIESFFSKAIRDTDSVNYSKAVTSYCAVVRLLHRYKADPRFITAKEGIANLEKKMGLEEGEVVCVEPDKGN